MPRTNSPHTRARDALNAAIRTLYEDTKVPVREIARLAGVSERNIYGLVRRLGCRSRGRDPVPAEDRIDPRAAEACARAAEGFRKITDQAAVIRTAKLATRQARSKRAGLIRHLNYLSRALRDLAAIDVGRPARAKRADLEARRQALARRLAAL